MEPEAPAPPPPLGWRARWSNRRIFFGLLMIGLVVVGMRLFHRRPVTAKVALRYGSAAAHLEAVDIDVLSDADDHLIEHLAFSYRSRPAPEIEQTKLHLVKGKYRFEMVLTHAGQRHPLERVIRIDDDADLMIDVASALRSQPGADAGSDAAQ